MELDRRVAAGLRSPFPDVRRWALDKIATGAADAVGAVPELIDLLNDKDPEVSLRAAAALEATARRPTPRRLPKALESREPPAPPRSIAPLPGDDEGESAERRSAGSVAVLSVLAAFAVGVVVGRSSMVERPVRPATRTRPPARLRFDPGRASLPGATPVATPVPLPPPPSGNVLDADWPQREAVKLSTARRYLAGGRAREAVALADDVLRVNPASGAARAVKDLARSQFGVIE